MSAPYPLELFAGRARDPANPFEAVVGYELAQAHKIHVGDIIDVRGKGFTVVGIRQPLPFDWISDAGYRIEISLDGLQTTRKPLRAMTVAFVIRPARTEEEKSIFLDEIQRRLQAQGLTTINDALARVARSFPCAWTLTPSSSQNLVRHAQAIYRVGLVATIGLLMTISGLYLTITLEAQREHDREKNALFKALGRDEGMIFANQLQRSMVVGAVSGLLAVAVGVQLCSLLNREVGREMVQLLCMPQLAAQVFLGVLFTVLLLSVVPATRVAQDDAGWTLFKVARGGSAS